MCGYLVIKGYKIAILPISRIDKTNLKLHKKTSLIWISKSHQHPAKVVFITSCAATEARQFIVIYGTMFMGVFSCATFFCQSTSVVSWAQFLLGEAAAETKLLPKLQPVQLYGTAGLHHTKLANTRWWKDLWSKVFLHSDTKPVAVGNELHTEYSYVCYM